MSAQTITATLTGAVHDPQGAAVPAAALTDTSVETAQTRAATSDSEGRFASRFSRPEPTRSQSPRRASGN